MTNSVSGLRGYVLALFGATVCTQSHAPELLEVDLELVLAADRSGSMSAASSRGRPVAGSAIRSRFAGHAGRSARTRHALRLKPDHSMGGRSRAPVAEPIAIAFERHARLRHEIVGTLQIAEARVVHVQQRDQWRRLREAVSQTAPDADPHAGHTAAPGHVMIILQG